MTAREQITLAGQDWSRDGDDSAAGSWIQMHPRAARHLLDVVTAAEMVLEARPRSHRQRVALATLREMLARLDLDTTTTPDPTKES